MARSAAGIISGSDGGKEEKGLVRRVCARARQELRNKKLGKSVRLVLMSAAMNGSLVFAASNGFRQSEFHLQTQFEKVGDDSVRELSEVYRSADIATPAKPSFETFPNNF